MKVFINKRVGVYSGGMIVVSANTPEEAQSILLAAFPDEIEMLDKDGDTCFNEEECVSKEHYNYKSNNWTELPGVSSIYEVPTFLAESGHSE